VPLHTLHTAPWNWPQPERFWPERWTSPEARGGPKGGAGTDGLKTAFLPFGAACVSGRVAEAQVDCTHDSATLGPHIFPHCRTYPSCKICLFVM
jgi:cytochrome P450